MAKGKNEYVVDKGKLTNGMVIDSHPVLCNLIGWKVCKPTSNSGKAQLKALSLCCKWHKDGRKYIIDEVYTEKKSKEVQVRQTTSALIKLGVEYNLLKIMLQCVTKDDVKIINNGESNEMEMLHCNYFTIPTLHKATGLVNDFYYQARHNQEVISDIEMIEQEIVKDFFNITHKKLNRIIKESLEQLRKKRLVTYHEGKKLTFVTYDYDSKELKNKGTVKGKRKYSNSFATKDQLAVIERCEREGMNKFNLSNFNHIYGRSQDEQTKFFRHVCKLVRDCAENSAKEDIQKLKTLDRYANAYEIYIVPQWLMSEMNKVEDNIEVAKAQYDKILESLQEYKVVQTQHDVRKVVNEKMIKSLSTNIVARHKKANIDSIRCKANYVDDCLILVDHYVNRKNDYELVRSLLIDGEILKDITKVDYDGEDIELTLNIRDIA